MFTVLLETGLRCGELIGLTWGDVDMANRELTVDHQLIYKDWGAGYRRKAVKVVGVSGFSGRQNEPYHSRRMCTELLRNSENSISC